MILDVDSVSLAEKYLEVFNDLLVPRDDYLLGSFGSFAKGNPVKVKPSKEKSSFYLSDMDLIFILPDDFKFNHQWSHLYKKNFSEKWKIPSIDTLCLTKDDILDLPKAFRNYLARSTRVLFGDDMLMKHFPVECSGRYDADSVIPCFISSALFLFMAGLLIVKLNEPEDAGLWFYWFIAKAFCMCGMGMARAYTCEDCADVSEQVSCLRRNNYFYLRNFSLYYEDYVKFKFNPHYPKIRYKDEIRNYIDLSRLFIEWWLNVLGSLLLDEPNQCLQPKVEEKKKRLEECIVHLKVLIDCLKYSKVSEYDMWSKKTMGRYVKGYQNLHIFFA